MASHFRINEVSWVYFFYDFALGFLALEKLKLFFVEGQLLLRINKLLVVLHLVYQLSLSAVDLGVLRKVECRGRLSLRRSLKIVFAW